MNRAPRLSHLSDTYLQIPVINKSEREAFRAGSIDSQFNNSTAIDGITFHLLGGTVMRDGGSSTKEEVVVDLTFHSGVFEM